MRILWGRNHRDIRDKDFHSSWRKNNIILEISFKFEIKPIEKSKTEIS